MKKIHWQPGTWLCFVLLLSACQKEPARTTASSGSVTDNMNRHEHHTPTVRVFSTGFNNPRGLKFGPDGDLYVAEGGLGGSDSTVGQCTQVIAPVGPYKGS